MAMDGDPAICLDPDALRLLGLAARCLKEGASRRLDGEIYCAIHDSGDLNPLSGDNLWSAKMSGQVLVRCRQSLVWMEAPPFTFERRYAETLLPDGLATICREARFVCAAALRARALTRAPPLQLSNVFEFSRG